MKYIKIIKFILLFALVGTTTSCNNITKYQSIIGFEVCNTEESLFAFSVDDRGRTLGYFYQESDIFNEPLSLPLPGDTIFVEYTGNIIGDPIYPPVFRLDGEFHKKEIIPASTINFIYKKDISGGIFVPEDPSFSFRYESEPFYFSHGTLKPFTEIEDGEEFVGRYSVFSKDSDGFYEVSCFVKTE